ncbi:MAG: CoA-binding protein [Desulfocapsaceae bacterium]|nr:CoA-binding protein [Desulfocapsaceae bacterium]
MQKIVDMNAIKKILEKSKVIALVGFSPKENRPSNLVGRYLMDAGYTVIPVNPGQTEIAGRKCYASLTEIPEKVDIVDIFRKPEDVVPIVEEAIAIGAGVIWMQLDVVNEQAAALAEAAGLTVIMDRCIKIDHSNLF